MGPGAEAGAKSEVEKTMKVQTKVRAGRIHLPGPQHNTIVR